MSRRNTIGAVVGAVAGLVLVSAFVVGYNTTATAPEDLVGRGTLILLLIVGGLGGSALGTALADSDHEPG